MLGSVGQAMRGSGVAIRCWSNDSIYNLLGSFLDHETRMTLVEKVIMEQNRHSVR